MRSTQSTSARAALAALALIGIVSLSTLVYRLVRSNADHLHRLGEGGGGRHGTAADIPVKEYALPAASTPAERQALARFFQSLYCAQFYPPPPSADGATLNYTAIGVTGFHPDPKRTPVVDGLGMYVLGGAGDAVSQTIVRYGSWEADLSQGFIAALAEAEAVGVVDPLFLDIGSNLGMHSVAVLAYGYRVVSIDALTMNAHHFMSTLCRHPKLMEKSTFIRSGLGSRVSTCAIVSSDANLGDGMVTCDPTHIAQYKAGAPPAGMHPLRQWLPIAPLDSFVDEDVWVVKMDVEGFELDVLQGGRNLFTRRRVPFLLTEIQGWGGGAPVEKSRRMVVLVAEYGYSCSEEGWFGKRWRFPANPVDVVLRDDIYNVWCIHPEHLRAAGLGAKVDAALANV
ncbi:S-adenosyl-L-methionine-dependent methyltransferase [Zopfochytrium polystomum]|nr:S-adenosyl-L-methionine-dependent methyltransferase [Zopfochytrium polystomum]